MYLFPSTQLPFPRFWFTPYSPEWPESRTRLALNAIWNPNIIHTSMRNGGFVGLKGEFLIDLRSLGDRTYGRLNLLAVLEFVPELNSVQVSVGSTRLSGTFTSLGDRNYGRMNPGLNFNYSFNVVPLIQEGVPMQLTIVLGVSYSSNRVVQPSMLLRIVNSFIFHGLSTDIYRPHLEITLIPMIWTRCVRVPMVFDSGVSSDIHSSIEYLIRGEHILAFRQIITGKEGDEGGRKRAIAPCLPLASGADARRMQQMREGMIRVTEGIGRGWRAEAGVDTWLFLPAVASL
ncbi:hypothetical protein B0H16DRAFT_1705970 [Mycena metata]|uniref:Uncharacterized protein n=1 Tax=Mycena metata TaxID=1033252 RepID=A0AAD7DT28_9AGAR|nr:hypothetical protein B0H16DRAFT_1705970 [Mycena metata]